MTSKSEYTGSCLCGQVEYRIVGNADRFYHCHCERCRKATGTGHASNLLISNPESAEFTRGEKQLTRYKLPVAKRFGTCFCSTCGSSMPRIPSDLSIVVVPAGTLDQEPSEKPMARIFYDSRSQWSCQDSDTPTFDEYPTK